MKKFLSLVLALVMTMSLVTVGAGAADFTDDDSITYEEAVEVMTALGVVGGYSDGSFGPKGTLTRGAAAKIICNLVLGTTAAEALVADTAPYSDVPVDNVFSGYIAYLAKEGIVGGYADGTFRPSATLTGYAFMKMLLGVIGLNADTEGYNSANWSIAVAKRALSKGVKLTKGLKGDFNGTKAVTREEACLYAFNAIKARVFTYGNTITVGNVTFGAGDASQKTDGQDNDLYRTILYGNDLKYTENDVVDHYGRPAHTWKYKKDKIGTYADEAVLVYTTGVKGTVLADDLDDAGYDIKKDTAIPCVRNNGTAVSYSYAEVNAALESTTKLGGNGVVIELFANDDDEINKVVVIVDYLAKVESLGKDKTSTKSVDERNIKISVGQKDYTLEAEADIDGFDDVYENVKKGDYILFTPAGDNSKSTTALSVSIPETVTGSLTYFKGTEKVKVGGETYETANTYAKGALGGSFALTAKDVTLYLDAYGYVAGYKGPSEGGDKAVVVLKAYNTLNEDGELVKVFKGVTSNGETVVWEYNNVNAPNKDTAWKYTEKDDVYTLNGALDSTVADGAFMNAGKKDIKSSAKSLTIGSERCYFDEDVKFIFVNDGKATVKDGVQKVSDCNVYATIKVDDGVKYITALFVIGDAGVTSTTSEEIVFVKKNSSEQAYVGSLQVTVDGKEKTFYTYDAYVNGEKLEDNDGFYAKSSSLAQGFYSIEIDDETGAYITSGNRYTTTTGELAALEGDSVTGFAGNLMTINSADYDLGSAVIVDLRENGEVDNVSDLKDLSTSAYKVSFLFDDDDNSVSYLYIVNA